MTALLAFFALLSLGVFPFLAWTTPRTWVPGELVTANMMNTHVRDNLNALRSEHFGVQQFRSLQLRTHPDQDVALSKVQVISADELVMDDGTRISIAAPITADITSGGAGGIDTGSETAATWYEVYVIAKDDGTKNVLLHRAKDYVNDQSQTVSNAEFGLRNDASRVKLAQGFKVTTVGKIEFIDLKIRKQGTPSGQFWATIQSDSTGSPSGTILAQSDKVAVNGLTTTAGFVRLVFRAPFTPADMTTQYHLVLDGNFAVDPLNYLVWVGDSVNDYVNGVSKQFDGTGWSVIAGILDFVFKIYVTRNDTAVLMPPPYTKKAKVGYVYNNSSGDFITFRQFNRSVFRLFAFESGTDNSTIPVLYDISSAVPPVAVKIWTQGGVAAAVTVWAAGVPDGFNPNTVFRAGTYMTPNGASEGNEAQPINPVLTEYQGIYIWSGAATNHRLRIDSWELPL